MYCWYLTLKAMFLRKYQYPPLIRAAVFSGITKQLKGKKKPQTHNPDKICIFYIWLLFLSSDFTHTRLPSALFFPLMRPNCTQVFSYWLAKKKYKGMLLICYILLLIKIIVFLKKKIYKDLWVLVKSVFQTSTCHFLQWSVIFSAKKTKTS